MNYNEMHLPTDRSNDRSTRYPSPMSPMDSLMASCPSFDMPHTPSLQDSPALPSYRVQFGHELSLLDENDRSSSGFSSSMAESYSMTAPDSSASFPLSLFDSNVFSEDTYGGPFGPMLVHHQPTSELSTWTPRSMATRENGQAALCLSPYAVNSGNAYGMPQRDTAGEYIGRSSFETVAGDSTASSETDSMPRTPETVAPSAAFGNFACLMEHNSSQRRGSSWGHTVPGSAASSFMEDDGSESMWKGLGMSSKALHDHIRPVELRQVHGSSSRRSQVSKRKRTSPRTQPERVARLDATISNVTYGIQLEHISKPTSRCDECNQNFQRPEHLTRHKKSASHTRATPFECELPRCLDKKTGRRKCFNRQDNKTAHIVKTHLTPAAKGRRDRVSMEEVHQLGWDKYLAAARKEQKKQDDALRRLSSSSSGRPSNNNTTTATTATSGVSGARITKRAFRRQQHAKALR